MARLAIATATLAAAFVAGPVTAGPAAQIAGGVVVGSSFDRPQATIVQYWRDRRHRESRRPYTRPYRPNARPYVAPGPRWAYRPWYRRPYYGTIIGGVALGTIIGVTAYGLAPRSPRPDLCWFWADEAGSRGYWDYCPDY